MELLKSLVCLVLLACIPYSSAVIDETIATIKYNPASCLDIKYLRPNVTRNGFYTIFDAENGLHTVYCDFNSEKPYVWTMVESFSRKVGMKDSSIKSHLHFQKPYTIDSPFNECRPDQFQAYRASKKIISLVGNPRISTYWRATCNFDLYAKGISKTFNHRDYVRGAICALNLPVFYSSSGSCYNMEYINIRGHSCDKCLVPFYSSTAMHPSVMASVSPTRCSHMQFGSFQGAEYNWGTYNGFSNEFSCTASDQSTTNWWFGGIYSPLDAFQNVKPL